MKIDTSYKASSFPHFSPPLPPLKIKKNLHNLDTLPERKRSKSSCSCSSWLASFFTKIKNYFFPKKHVTRHKKTRERKKAHSSNYSYPKNYCHPVVGIIRKNSDNCCFNAIMQGLINIPSWQKAVQEIPACRDFIDAYEQAVITKKPVPKLYADSIRNFLSKNNKGNAWGRGQEDASEILMGLFNASSCAPSFGLERIHPTESSRLEEGTFIHFHRGTLCDEIFTDLIQDAFIEDTVDKKFIEAPEEFIVYNSVFVADHKKGIIKNTLPMQGEIANVTLPPSLLPNQETVCYTCDYFLIHEGSASGGHYTCALKKEGTWLLIDDHKVTSIAHDQAEALMRTSTLLHYTRCSGIGVEA